MRQPDDASRAGRKEEIIVQVWMHFESVVARRGTPASFMSRRK